MRANCTICSDLFDGINTIIATPCGHVFHEVCCLQWLEHSKTCPACRQKMTAKSTVRLYFTMGGDDSFQLDNDDSKLRNELETVKASLKQKDMEKRKLVANMDDLRKAVIKAEDQADNNHQKYLECQGQVTAMRLQVKQLVKENSVLQNVADDNRRLLNQVHHLKNVQSIIDSCQNDVSTILSSWGSDSMSAKETATYIALLKRELQSSRESRSKLANEIRGLKHDLGLKSSQLKDVEKNLVEADIELTLLREALQVWETDGEHRTPSSASKRKFTSPETTPKENTPLPTPFKRPRINMVSAVVSLVHEKAGPAPKLPQTTVLVPESNLFRQSDGTSHKDKSVISEGYNGLGGHTKFVSRSAPLKMKFTTLNKKSTSSKAVSNPTLDKFFSF